MKQLIAIARQVNRRLRKSVTRVFQRMRGSSAAPIGPGMPMTWPPIRRASDLHDLVNRLRWFLPDGLGEQVLLPCEHLDDQALSRTTEDSTAVVRSKHRNLSFSLIHDGSAWSRCLERAALVFNWNLLNLSTIRLSQSIAKTAIIDPDWYFETEAREWTRLFYLGSNPGTIARLQEASNRSFARLLERAAKAPQVNVCGNGPGLKGIYARVARDSLNLICNTAISSKALTDHLQPLAVAFCDHYYFGPSKLARDFISDAVRCVRKYDSFVLVPAGYAHWLLAIHYPELVGHLIGLQGIAGPPALDLPVVPTAERLAVKSVGNVITDMLLPVAGALGPQRIRIWGCDGRALGEEKLWSYLPELNQSSAPAAATHPAYFRDRLESEATFRRRYALHCEYMESLICLIESTGVEVMAASESHIPALRGRHKTDLQHV